VNFTLDARSVTQLEGGGFDEVRIVSNGFCGSTCAIFVRYALKLGSYS
jgi:hypothetical protein